MYQEQQKIWQDELKKADERSSKLKKDISNLNSSNQSLAEEVRLLTERVSSREEEIARLSNITPAAG